MITKIEPVLVSRGVTAGAFRAYTIFDNQMSRCTWFYQYGNMVTPPAREVSTTAEDGTVTVENVQDADQFVGVDNQAGNLTLDGDAYKEWPGDAEWARNWLCEQLDVVPVKS